MPGERVKSGLSPSLNDPGRADPTDQARRFRTEQRPPSIAPRASPRRGRASAVRATLCLTSSVYVATWLRRRASGQGLKACRRAYTHRRDRSRRSPTHHPVVRRSDAAASPRFSHDRRHLVTSTTHVSDACAYNCISGSEPATPTGEPFVPADGSACNGGKLPSSRRSGHRLPDSL